MATFTLPSRSYAAGEQFSSSSVTIPTTVVQARITLNLSPAQAIDPDTDVEGQIQWAPAGTADDSPEWRMAGSTRLVGNPANNTSQQPYIEISPASMSTLRGHLTRGIVINRGAAAITFAATVIVS